MARYSYSNLVREMQPAITVKYLTLVDALGRKRSGWTILDGSQICGQYQTEAEANKQAEALKAIRHTSR